MNHNTVPQYQHIVKIAHYAPHVVCIIRGWLSNFLVLLEQNENSMEKIIVPNEIRFRVNANANLRWKNNI